MIYKYICIRMGLKIQTVLYFILTKLSHLLAQIYQYT